ncbi:hypothetical protein TRFO_36552 [Tritrichomonas foetus]|uniref:Uncharacterized protein n=1 Tax=Tritrichomonas foetus TaxID=1144522 RepID=A0A1J4JI23_9EUKA|nr:hypothetical protein TRFO_36552 [Tritrichomonas foetus]|eukprot:OHS97235.1 hypothetical protein TRFO_36552 [Tritrichomonas foetus]
MKSDLPSIAKRSPLQAGAPRPVPAVFTPGKPSSNISNPRNSNTIANQQKSPIQNRNRPLISNPNQHNSSGHTKYHGNFVLPPLESSSDNSEMSNLTAVDQNKKPLFAPKPTQLNSLNSNKNRMIAITNQNVNQNRIKQQPANKSTQKRSNFDSKQENNDNLMNNNYVDEDLGLDNNYSSNVINENESFQNHEEEEVDENVAMLDSRYADSDEDDDEEDEEDFGEEDGEEIDADPSEFGITVTKL